MQNKERCGYVAIIGRPNVGKSTLLNHLIGQKISITSRKPQTTRHRLLGIKTVNHSQIIYVDTPGLHQRRHHAMNRYLNRAATSSIIGVDLVIWLVEALQWTDEDEFVLKILLQANVPSILGINKIDKVSNKENLFPYLQSMETKTNFSAIIPLSALKSDNLPALENKIVELLPMGIHIFPKNQITDRSERFIVSEIIREKLFRRLGDELPYHITVQIEMFSRQEKITHINALIWVERQGQKIIVIGKKGKILKSVGEQARKEIETLIDHKVFLQLWVKVKAGWHDSERSLQQLGYID
ncbi:MAG: GTPase Era [Thiomargarita sp.]|nr:GTPase Era [Thiomargarita sp.]